MSSASKCESPLSAFSDVNNPDRRTGEGDVLTHLLQEPENIHGWDLEDIETVDRLVRETTFDGLLVYENLLEALEDELEDFEVEGSYTRARFQALEQLRAAIFEAMEDHLLIPLKNYVEAQDDWKKQVTASHLVAALELSIRNEHTADMAAKLYRRLLQDSQFPASAQLHAKLELTKEFLRKTVPVRTWYEPMTNYERALKTLEKKITPKHK